MLSSLARLLLTIAFQGSGGAMDQREIFAEFGGAPDIDSGEAGGVGLNALDTRDVETNGVAASDGDGGMLGRVLIYATIIAVGVAILVWNRSV